MNPEIVALGEPLLEFNAVESGTLKESLQYELGFGGDTSNFAIAASRAGRKVGYISRIGDDDFGQALFDLWQREGIDTRHVISELDGQTGIYFISRVGDEHSFTYYRSGSAASHLSVADIPHAYIANAKVLHVSGISQAISSSACDAVFHAIRVARQSGTIISYDPNVRPKLWEIDRARAVIMETIRMSDFVLPSMEDAKLLTGLDDPQAIADILLALGPRAVLLKLGPDGVLLASDQTRCQIDPYAVKVVDTTGAGDAFDGYFVANYVRGLSIRASAMIANMAAALTVTGKGAVLPIPTWDQVAPHFSEILETSLGHTR